MVWWVCVNNKGVPGSLTGAYGVAHDVDDDTGYADVGHPGYSLLSTHNKRPAVVFMEGVSKGYKY